MMENTAIKEPEAGYGVTPIEQVRGLDGLSLMKGIMEGRFPAPPISRALGFSISHIEHGRVTFDYEPVFDHYNPLGSVQFGYHKVTDQLVEERQFNQKGQLVRRLFYPGALRETVSGKEYGNRFVAFNYDPNDPNAKPVQSKEVVKPTKPVESDQDDFDPQIPTGRVVEVGTQVTI